MANSFCSCRSCWRATRRSPCGRVGYSRSISAIQELMSSAGRVQVVMLLIVDLLRLDDDALRRTREGGVKDTGTRRQRRAAGEPMF
jgi:hypothetical protein